MNRIWTARKDDSLWLCLLDSVLQNSQTNSLDNLLNSASQKAFINSTQGPTLNTKTSGLDIQQD